MLFSIGITRIFFSCITALAKISRIKYCIRWTRVETLVLVLHLRVNALFFLMQCDLAVCLSYKAFQKLRYDAPIHTSTKVLSSRGVAQSFSLSGCVKVITG